MLELGRALTARVGGIARTVYAPQDRDAFVATVAELRERDEPFHLLGGGSNVLAADGVLRGSLVLTRGLRLVERRAPHRFAVEAGANLTALGHHTARLGLHGLECCVGIPGTIGAAVRINAGGKYGEIGAVVREVTVVTPGGCLERRSTCAGDFGYRRSSFQGDLIVAAELELSPSPAPQCLARVKEVLAHKRRTQPLRYPSAGCIFRNPPGDSAGRLIDACGLKGERAGDAMVSPRHANYIVNLGRATGSDFLALIEHVRAVVLARTGVGLELEVEVWR